MGRVHGHGRTAALEQLTPVSSTVRVREVCHLNSKVLLIEDDADIREVLSHHLSRASFQVQSAGTVAEGWDAFRTWHPDLVILDLMLSDGHGLDLCRRMRDQDEALGILILTAMADETDQVAGLELGADDYVTKPFRARELVARARAVLRRIRRPLAGSKIRVGRLTLDPGRMTVTINEQPAPLTALEFGLLHALTERPGAILSRKQLLDRVWGEDFVGDERTVDVHVRHIRAKFEPFDAAHLIDTVRGIGYRLKEESS